MPSKFADEFDLPDEVDQAPVVDQAPIEVPQVAVRVADEYAADAPWYFGFAGENSDELEIGVDPVKVDAPLASKLLESPMIVAAD